MQAIVDECVYLFIYASEQPRFFWFRFCKFLFYMAKGCCQSYGLHYPLAAVHKNDIGLFTFPKYYTPRF